MVTYRAISSSKDGAIVVITPGFGVEIKILRATKRGKISLKIKSDKPLEFFGKSAKLEPRNLGKMRTGETEFQIDTMVKELLLVGHADANLASVRIDLAGVFSNGWVLFKVSAGFQAGDIEDCAILDHEELSRLRCSGEVSLGASHADVLRSIVQKRVALVEAIAARRKEQMGGRRITRKPGMYGGSR